MTHELRDAYRWHRQLIGPTGKGCSARVALSCARRDVADGIARHQLTKEGVSQ